MGYSNFTRYHLYEDAYRTIDEVEFLNVNDYSELKRLFNNSAVLIQGFEERIIQSYEVLIHEFEELFLTNMDRIHNDSEFQYAITEKLRKQREKKTVKTYKSFWMCLLKALAEYQDRKISEYFHPTMQYRELKERKPQTFLSYAYSDKGLSLALFYFFWKKYGFLYVDWMWEGANSNGTITKNMLEKALAESEQLLLLRTTNSELHMPGNYNFIRQWCSWEIGNFYTKHKTEKYYTSFYDRVLPTNDILDSFKPMRDIVQGKIIPFMI